VRRRGAGECCWCVWERCGGDDGRHNSIGRTLEEEEARLLHLEVSSIFFERPWFRWTGAQFMFPRSQGGADRFCPSAC
jgi:hypothetical protein